MSSETVGVSPNGLKAGDTVRVISTWSPNVQVGAICRIIRVNVERLEGTVRFYCDVTTPTGSPEYWGSGPPRRVFHYNGECERFEKISEDIIVEEIPMPMPILKSEKQILQDMTRELQELIEPFNLKHSDDISELKLSTFKSNLKLALGEIFDYIKFGNLRPDRQ